MTLVLALLSILVVMGHIIALKQAAAWPRFHNNRCFAKFLRLHSGPDTASVFHTDNHLTREGTMNRIIIVIAALGAAMAYSIYVNPDEPSAPPEPLSTIAEPGPAANVPNATPQPEKIVDVDDGTEVVLGIRVRKDRKCTVELKDYVTPDGRMFSAYTCTPNEPRPAHPYAHYDNETLASMSWSDAEAAALLGQRLVDKDTGRSYKLLIRATALDGDTMHISWLADMAFNPTAVNGEPHVANLESRYKLAELNARLGSDPVLPKILKRELANAGISKDRFSELDARADALLRVMQDIQRDVYGEVRIGGQDDV